jgi:hypothetical protein
MSPQEIIVKFANIQRFTTGRNVLCGAGLAYAMANGKYTHLPLIVFIPSIYAGYQMYNHRNTIRDWVRECK